MNDKFTALPIKRQITSSISERQLDRLTAIVVDHPRVKAAVSLQGAHLMHWQPAGQRPVFWMSDSSPFTEHVSIRGGIPICFPWFGAVAEPTHGLARLLPWELTSHEEDNAGVRLVFTLRDDEQTRAKWPHAFTLLARISLGETCRVELEARGDYDITTALHTHFYVGDIERISIEGLGDACIDRVNPENTHPLQEALTFAGRTERVYTHPQDVSLIHDPVLKRTIEVRHHNHSDVVTWNPGEEAAKNFRDIHPGGYRNFVCVETARANQPLVATAASPARLAVTIALRPLV